MPRKRGSSINRRGFMVTIPESTDQEANAPGTTSGDAKGDVRGGKGGQKMLSHRSARPLAKSANSRPGHFGTISVDGKTRNSKQMSDSGLKERVPPHFATGNLLVSDVLASNRNDKRELAHRPLHKEKDNLEY